MNSWNPAWARYIRPDGPEDARVAFIGEAGGRDEDREGVPFVGRSGELLWQFAARYARLTRDEVWVHNLWPYWTGPGNPDPTPEQVEQGRRQLLLKLQRLPNLELIVALGRYSAAAILDREVTMERDHALPFSAAAFMDDEAERWPTCIPVYHPAAGMHSSDMLTHTARGLQAVGRWLRDELEDTRRPQPAPVYRKLETWQDVHAVFGNHHERLIDTGPRPFDTLRYKVAIDTEGSVAKPFCLTFAFDNDGRHAYAIPADAEGALSAFRRRISKRHEPRITIALHSALHDIPVLRAMGIDLVEMRVPFVDTIVDAYLLQDEPQGLKALAWRKLGLGMRDFEDVAGPYCAHARVKWLYGAASQLSDRTSEHKIVVRRFNKGRINRKTWEREPPKELKPKILQCQCDECRLRKLAWRALADFDKDAAAGGDDDVTLHKSITKRWNGWDEWKQAGIVAAAGTPFPEPELSRVPESEWLPYACDDAYATAQIEPLLQARIEEMELQETQQLDLAIIPMVERMAAVGMGVDAARIPPLLADLEKEQRLALGIIRELTDWEDFNPASGDQCAELLFERLKLPPVKLTKSKTRWSTDDKVLQELATALETNAGADMDAFLGDVAETCIAQIVRYREHNKLAGTYVKPLPSFVRDGRVHPQLRTTRVVSGRLSSFDPNLLAFPSKTKIGRRCRSLFVAGEGRVFISVDLSQIELRVMAHESQDEAMIAAFVSGKDLHTQTAALMFGLDVDALQAAIDSEDTDAVGKRYAAKTLNFAILYGITPEGLYAQFRLAGLTITLDECRELIRRWLGAYPGVTRYMGRTCSDTRLDGFVREPGGRLRHLPAIYLQGHGWPFEFLRGEAERQAVNHRIQGGAQTLLKRRMVRLHNETLPELRDDLSCYIEALLQVHDELIFECDEDYASIAAKRIQRVMCEEPGYRVPLKASAKIAQDWGMLK